MSSEVVPYRKALQEIREALNGIKLLHTKEQNEKEREDACIRINEILEGFEI